jgi:hypothetical protein
MHDRLKDGGIVTFWLPISQLTTDETKAILRAFHNVFSNASVWATCDLEWIMMGSKGPLQQPDQEFARSFWSEAKMRSDLGRIGIESPEQMSGLFVMDSEEIERITQGVEPLSDFYPKRLTDAHPDLKAAYQFGRNYFEPPPHFVVFFPPLLSKKFGLRNGESLSIFFFSFEKCGLSRRCRGVTGWPISIFIYGTAGCARRFWLFRIATSFVSLWLRISLSGRIPCRQKRPLI